VAYHTIGKHLLAASPANRHMSYDQDILVTFTAEWSRLGGFPLSPTGAKYCKLFASAFDDPTLLRKAIAAGLTWTRLRDLSRKEVSTKDRRAAVANGR
jgi:hypothetical protein